MAKKIFCGVCAAIALLSCTLFAFIDYSRNFNRPLFYKHYITYNVRAAYRDTQATAQMQQALRDDPGRIEDQDFSWEGLSNPRYYTVEWIGIAAAINTGHTLQITSAVLDLNELGVYKLTNVNDSVYKDEQPYEWTDDDEHIGVISGTQFKTGVSAMAFEPEDLKALAESIVNPVTVESMLVNYIYDGKEYTENVPIGKITLYSADSSLARLTEDTAPARPNMTQMSRRGGAASLSFQPRPGCTVESVSLPYPSVTGDLMSLTIEQDEDGTIRTGGANFDGRGLICLQLDYIVRGTDADGAEVTTVTDYQNYSFSTLSSGAQNVLTELKNRRGGDE